MCCSVANPVNNNSKPYVIVHIPLFVMEEDKISSAFEKEGIGSEIKCPQAFSMAEKYDLKKSEIAAYCNTHGIKIRSCQLGCFK
jgi:hypothetical protein